MINKIVLDVLEPYDLFNTRKEDIAKSISAKIQAVSIDREEVTKILIKSFPMQGFNNYQNKEWVNYLEKLAQKILSLLKPVEGLEELKADLHQANIDKEKYFIEAEELDREVKGLKHKLKQLGVKIIEEKTK